MTRRIARNVLALLTDAPWAILPSALETMVAIARRENLPVEAIEAERGEPLEHTHAVTVRDGVARIPVEGPLFRRADMFARMSGATSYETLAADLTAALADPAVTAIVLDFDSPGGEVTGCDEMAGLIFDARGVKQLTAYVSGHACSAAYWLASACDEIIAAPTAILGSIGACISYVDDAGYMKEHGFRRIQIVSSQSPRKNLDPATDEGRSEIQVTLDALAEVFVATVARNREVAVDAVLKRYGQGGVMVGADAVAAGLADALGSYEDVVQALLPDPADSAAPGSVRLVASATADPEAAAHTHGSNTVTTESEMAKRTLRATRRLGAGAGANGPGAADETETDEEETPGAAEGDEEETPEDEDETAAEGDEEEEDEETAEGDEEEEEEKPATSARERKLVAAGAKQERARISAIDKLALPGHAKLIGRAKAEGWSANKTARRILAAEQLRRGDKLAAMQEDLADDQAPRGFARSPSVGAKSDDATADFIMNAGKRKPAGTNAGAKAGR